MRIVVPLKSHPNHRYGGEYSEADGDKQQRSFVITSGWMENLQKMHPDGDYAQSVSNCDREWEATIQRDIQKDGWKETQNGKTEECHPFRVRCINVGGK